MRTDIWVTLEDGIAVNKYQDRYLDKPEYTVWEASTLKDAFPFDAYQTVSSDTPLGRAGKLVTRCLPKGIDVLPAGEERSMAVRAFFASLEQQAETYIRKAFPNDFQTKAVNNDDVVQFSPAQTSREIKKHLIQKFASGYSGLKFSVTLKHGSLRIRWMDGPSRTVVEELVNVFEGDKMVQNGGDMIRGRKEYVEWNGKKIDFGVGFIFCERELSYPLIRMVMQYVAQKYGYPAPKIEKVGENSWKQLTPSSWEFDHWLSETLQTFDAHDVLVWSSVEG
jgi:hypothetical protein